MHAAGTHSVPDQTCPHPCTSGPFGGGAGCFACSDSGGRSGKAGLAGGLASGGGASGSAPGVRTTIDPAGVTMLVGEAREPPRAGLSRETERSSR